MNKPRAYPAEAAALVAAFGLLIAAFAVRAGRDGCRDVEPVLPEGYSVDLNTAGAPELALLPGIGPGLAEAILEWRERNGPFREPGDLLRVPGIGASRARAILRCADFGGAGETRGSDRGRHHSAGFE